MATFAEPGTTSISAEDIKSDMDGPLPPKRKPEVTSVDRDNTPEMDNDLNKKQKIEIPSLDKDNPLLPDVEDSKVVSEPENNGIQPKKEVEEGSKKEVEEGAEDDDEDEDEEDYEDDEEDDDDEDDDNSDDEESNVGAEVIDPKGKGILKDEKGKGKLIEESEDSSGYGTESDGDSDLSDDPLAEVDLDNILPSRTRRRGVQPGVHISSDRGSKQDKDDDNDGTS